MKDLPSIEDFKTRVERLLWKSIHLLVIFGCLIFTVFQSIQCVVKFQSSPRGTSTKFMSSHHNFDEFPAMTICSRKVESASYFKEEKLLECQVQQG